jgi:hypothetical protein
MPNCHTSLAISKGATIFLLSSTTIYGVLSEQRNAFDEGNKNSEALF